MNSVSTVRSLLRKDLSFSPPFTVSELPHKAKLDQNEAPFDIPEDIKTLLLDQLKKCSWNRYPQPSMYADAKEAFARAIGFPPENTVLTIGCDQLIQGFYLVAGGHDRKALVFEPAYPMFCHAAKFNRTQVTRVQLAPDETVKRDHIIESNHHIIFIVAPNNPTGTIPDEGVIEAALLKNSLLFLDEAYGDFSGRTWAHLLKDNHNLFIARTTSKSCMAGIRLGYGIGHPDIINAMETMFTAPYHLSYFQLIIAKHFNLIQPHLKNLSGTIIKERERIERRFADMGISCIPSQANFILFKVNNPLAVFHQLAESGVRIRSLHTIPGLSCYLRVTVGKREENDLFLEKLKSLSLT